MSVSHCIWRLVYTEKKEQQNSKAGNNNVSDCSYNMGRIINEAIVLHPLRRDHNNHESVYFTFYGFSHMWNTSIIKKK